MKLREPRQVKPPTCLARWLGSSGSATADLRIDIDGCDPRLVLVFSIWVKRSNDQAGPEASQQTLGSGVTWTPYSAIKDERDNLTPLKALPGFEGRTVRAANPWGADGIPQFGDSVELSASSPLVMGVHCAAVNGEGGLAVDQTLWFALSAYPSDAILENDGTPEDRESYRGILSKVTCSVSPVADLARVTPG